MNMEYLASNLRQRKLQQATIFSTVFSSSTTHIVGATDANTIITCDYVDNPTPCLQKCDKVLYSACLVQNKTFCGSDGCILSWETDELLNKHSSSMVMDLECGEVNALCAGENNTLLSGCGNGMLYSIDASTSTIVSKRRGHSNFIHSVASHEHTITSCDDSGVVLVWDNRVAGAVKKLDMSRKLDDNRCWASAVQMNSNGTFLYVGGGALNRGYLAIAHIGSIGSSDGVVKVADTQVPIQSMLVMEDEVLTGGPQSQLHYRSTTSLDLMSTTQVSASSVFSIAKHPTEDIVAVAGTVPIIDLFLIKGHRARIINPLETM